MGRKVVEMKAAQPRGVWGHTPPGSFKFRVSEMPSCFFCRTFSVNNTQENAVASCLFYPSLVLLERFSVYGKKEASDAVRIQWNNK